MRIFFKKSVYESLFLDIGRVRLSLELCFSCEENNCLPACFLVRWPGFQARLPWGGGAEGPPHGDHDQELAVPEGGLHGGQVREAREEEAHPGCGVLNWERRQGHTTERWSWLAFLGATLNRFIVATSGLPHNWSGLLSGAGFTSPPLLMGKPNESVCFFVWLFLVKSAPFT